MKSWKAAEKLYRITVELRLKYGWILEEVDDLILTVGP